MDPTTQYPHHLAKLVASRLRDEQGASPPETVLIRLLETLYFASLKTEEGRRILCTVNYADPNEAVSPPSRKAADRWAYARFDRPLPFDVRTLKRLGGAADPTVLSLAVFGDRKNRLFVWAMVDQEPRYTDSISLEAEAADRPGLFQATITGPGNVSVFSNGVLLGSLVQNTLVQEYHNVLWSGPVHAILRANLEAYLAERFPGAEQSQGQSPEVEQAAALAPDRADGADGAASPGHRRQQELLLRWVNSVCRILVSIQDYHRGGGLLIAPHDSLEGLSVNYPARYDRLPKSLSSLVDSYLFRSQWEAGGESAAFRAELDDRKNEVLGTIRFIASLSCVDGVVLLDRGLAVRGFGVEIRTLNPLSDVFLAGDARATAALLRRVGLAQFGTRHCAMMRYCHEHPGTLGFVVSRDGEIRAMVQLGEKLVLWENIDVQLAFPAEKRASAESQRVPVLRRVITRVE